MRVTHRGACDLPGAPTGAWLTDTLVTLVSKGECQPGMGKGLAETVQGSLGSNLGTDATLALFPTGTHRGTLFPKTNTVQTPEQVGHHRIFLFS